MYYLLSVDHNGMVVHPPEVTVKGFKKCCISNAMDGTDDDMLWNGSEEDRNVTSECEKDKALTVKMETVTPIGKGRKNLTCYWY
jgi:hypothetical protein